MASDNSDILFASLVGSKGIEQAQRFNLLQNEMQKHALPGIPYLPFQNEIDIQNGGDPVTDTDGTPLKTWKDKAFAPKNEQFFPLTLLLGKIGNVEIKYTLPYEPMINISGKHELIRRNVSKATINSRGSVKERWTLGDYEITITGMLMGENMKAYPKKDFENLRDAILKCKVGVECEPLQLLEINDIVIETFDFPFTKGENVQAYEIKAYSDFSNDWLQDITVNE